MFNMACEFIIYEFDKTDDEWVKKEQFNGTFIDALNYIKENSKG